MNGHLSSLGAACANHLWQCTVFALVVWALTWILRRNHARVRYALWLLASAKFLVPLSLLIYAGTLWPHPQRSVPVVYSAVSFVEEPFVAAVPPPGAPVADSPTVWEQGAAILPMSLGILWALGAGVVFIVWWNRWRAASSGLRKTAPAVDGRELGILRGLEDRLQSERSRGPLLLRLSAERMEPAIFGLLRPALVWPQQLSDRLDDEQMEAVLAHEWMHVRRRDNLTAALHMVVEAIFWFHPLVWWMDRKMIKEREQACDEAVIEMGGDAGTYAESLLETCRFCVESRLPCVAGVTGAELKERIARILSARVLMRMTWPKKLLLIAVGIVSLAIPTVAGMVWAQARQTKSTVAPEDQNLKFAVVSIRQNKTGGLQIFGKATPDGYEMRYMFLLTPILTAYPPTGGATNYHGVIGGPGWLVSDKDRYNIDAKVAPADLADWQNPQKQPAMLRAMLQAMLADRMKLKVHRSSREGPVYALVVGKKGPRFKATDPNETHPGASPMPGGGKISMQVKGGWTTTHYFGISVAQLISFGVLPQMGRPIEDRTGLTGKYDMTIVRRARPHAGTSEAGPSPQTSAADIADQLGLKLNPAEGQMETLVIDHVERPSEN